MTSELKKTARNPARLVLAVAGTAGIAMLLYFSQHGGYLQETNDATLAADQVAISSKLAGYVRRVDVADNQPVTLGAPLLEIDPADYQSRLDAAAAELAGAIAAVDANKAAWEEAKAGVDVARAQIQAAAANADFAARELARSQPLLQSGAESANSLSQLTASRDRAVAELASARASLTQAERRADSITAQGAQLAAQIQLAQARRNDAANDLAATRLVAPIAGSVAGRGVRVGQYIQPGLRLLTIVPTQDLYVTANFKEVQVGLMRPGQPAQIRVDALPGIVFHGRVVSITPGTGANFSLIPPQNATGNFTKIVQRVPVRIAIDAGPAARQVLAPGMSIDVTVDTSTAQAQRDAIRAEQARAGQ
jgi:membrane fusion protein (multidrug efflux system)